MIFPTSAPVEEESDFTLEGMRGALVKIRHLAGLEKRPSVSRILEAKTYRTRDHINDLESALTSSVLQKKTPVWVCQLQCREMNDWRTTLTAVFSDRPKCSSIFTHFCIVKITVFQFCDRSCHQNGTWNQDSRHDLRAQGTHTMQRTSL